MDEGSSFSRILSALVIVRLCRYSHPNGWAMVSRCILICISRLAKDVQCLLTPSVGELPVHALCPSLSRLRCLLMCCRSSSKYKPFLHIHFANILPHDVSFLLILLMVTSETHKNFILLKLNWFMIFLLLIVLCTLGVISEKPLLNLRSQRCKSMLFYNFISCL